MSTSQTHSIPPSKDTNKIEDTYFYIYSLETKKTKSFSDAAEKCQGFKRPDKTCSAALVTVEDLDGNKNIGKICTVIYIEGLVQRLHEKKA